MTITKFEILLKRKDGTDYYYEHLTLDDLINRNGCLFHPDIWGVVYKRQFTGLKDTTGRELYEDDFFEDGRGNILRCWIGDGVMLAGGINKEWYDYLTSIAIVKIVGNIYDNKEQNENIKTN